MEIQETNSNHFVLKGLPSILIGAYILVGAYIIKAILDKLVVTDESLETISLNGIQLLILAVIFHVLVASTLTIYLIEKNKTKKLKKELWNLETKLILKKFVLGIVIITLTLLTLLEFDFYTYLTPIFLLFYGILLYILKNSNRKDFLILAALSALLGVLSFMIPTYWYSSLVILGVAHITYGVVNR
jgi:hypothetical protein